MSPPAALSTTSPMKSGADVRVMRAQLRRLRELARETAALERELAASHCLSRGGPTLPPDGVL